ncbi:unnamed protein product [Parajaminaea phylloscopi]
MTRTGLKRKTSAAQGQSAKKNAGKATSVSTAAKRHALRSAKTTSATAPQKKASAKAADAARDKGKRDDVDHAFKQTMASGQTVMTRRKRPEFPNQISTSGSSHDKLAQTFEDLMK